MKILNFNNIKLKINILKFIFDHKFKNVDFLNNK
jgi:hypothetical protein